MRMGRSIPVLIGLLLLACGSASVDTANAGIKERTPGELLFIKNCTLCHGRDGKMGINGAKDLSISKLTRAEMIAMVEQGKGQMMPYNKVLSAKEIELVVEHVRTLSTSTVQ